MRILSKEHKEKIKDTCAAVKRLEKMQQELFECLINDLELVSSVSMSEETEALSNWLFDIVHNTTTQEEEDAGINMFANKYHNLASIK
jgi:hypothetical protein